MYAERLSSSLAFALAVALVYYILSMETVLALLLAVTAHELAHVIVLRMVGLRVKRLRLELTGLCIDYCGYACPAGHAAAALAGPAGGLAYAYFASLLARRLSCGWLEVSSVSNFDTYQANRLKCRYRGADKKTHLCHTLNGSALALPRILAALLENNQTPEGIRVPKCLQKYTGFDIID